MDSAGLLIEQFGRIRGTVHAALDGASAAALAYRPDAEANTIAWLVWHLSRVQDDHIAELLDGQQLWTTGGWAQRFALPFDDRATGYGQSVADVAAVRADAELLAAYYDAVHERTLEFLAGVTDAGLAAVVDESWNPPVTLAVRLASVLSDDLQHAGQASYVRGLAKRAGP